MRILQLTYTLSPGGAERLCVDLCNAFVKKGHQVYICVVRDLSQGEYNFYKSDLHPDVHVMELKIPAGFSFRYFTELYRAIHSVSPDVVHSHLNIIRYLFPLRFLFPSVRFVHTIHNDAPREVSFRLEYLFAKLFFKRKWIHPITISAETSKSFIAYYGIQPVMMINNGRSHVQKSEHFEETAAYVRSLRRTAETVILLHIGRFAPQKNQGMLVSVINRFIREGYDLQLLMVGSGYDTPDGLALQATSCSAIHYLGARHNVGDYYYASDAFCLSSLHEGFPITLIEAMCCGCIPICTPVGGCLNIIQNGENGFLSVDCSEEAYYDAVSAFLKSRLHMEKNRLTRYFEEHLSIDVCADQYLQAYTSR